MTMIRKLLADGSGATAIEYALIVAFIVLAAIGSYPTISDWLNGVVMPAAEAMS